MASNNEPNIVTKRESVEVITPDGNTLPSGGSKNLSDIFDKIEGNMSADQAIKEVMTNKPAVDPAVAAIKIEEPKKVEPAKEEPKAEPKKEEPTKEKTLDDVLDTQQTALDIVSKQKVDDKPVDEVSEEELAVLPHDKPKTAKRIQALLAKITKEANVVTETRREADEKAAKVKELEAKLQEIKPVDPATQEAVKQQLDELAQYRRRYALDKDPEVKSRYDSRIQKADEAIYKTLTDRGAGEPLLKLVKDEGGWSKFASSQRIVTMNDGSKQTSAELATAIVDNLPYSERRQIDAAVIEQLQAVKDKERFYEEETKKATEYFSKQEQQQAQGQQQQQKFLDDSRKSIADWHKSFEKENTWLNDKEIPTNATAEQKASIQEDNDWAKQIREEKQKYAGSKNLQEILTAVGNAVKYHHERHQNSKLIAENKALKEKIDSFKTAGRSTVRSGSLVGGGATASEAKANKPKSLEEFLDRRESGDDAKDE